MSAQLACGSDNVQRRKDCILVECKRAQPGESQQANETTGLERALDSGTTNRHDIDDRRCRAEAIVNSIDVALISTDAGGNIDYLNGAAEQMTGWSVADACGRPLAHVIKAIKGASHVSEISASDIARQGNKAAGANVGRMLIRRDGHEAVFERSTVPIYDANGQSVGAVTVFNDVTSTQEMVMKLAHLAQHDFLTNLPNRLLLNDRLAQSLSWAKRHGTTLAVLFLDLDNFKHINDSLGHEIGDKLLQSVAQRLSSCVRACDTISRQGGDEFVLLISEENEAESATLTADKILSSLAQPHFVAGHELHVTTSIGISIYPSDGLNADTLIKNADTAMYQAKEKGRNNYQFFKRDMNVRARERQEIEASLRRALKRNEFALHYQPKVNLTTGMITGGDAVLRWIDPESGASLPEDFPAIAEDCGLLVPIGRWVLQEACAQAVQWTAAGLEFDSVGVTVSAMEFRRSDFVSSVTAILKATGLAPAKLQIEIAENVLMRDADTSLAILEKLKQTGVQLAIGRFGSGYTSFTYLARFPVDVLKIDRTLLRDMDTDPGKQAMLTAAISVGQILKKKIVAEGMGDRSHLDFLKEHRCDEGQGSFLSEPLAAGKFAFFLKMGHPLLVELSSAEIDAITEKSAAVVEKALMEQANCAAG